MRTIEKVKDDYLKACIMRENAQERGDSKIANKQYKIIQKIRNELKNSTSFGLEILLDFLEHPSDHVKLITAYSIIPIEPDKAKKVLLSLKDIKGLDGYSAEKILEEWEKGNLNFDW